MKVGEAGGGKGGAGFFVFGARWRGRIRKLFKTLQRREVGMHEYKNEKIVVRYDKDVCTHSGNCVKGLPAVFDVNKNPWVNVNEADAETIIRTVRNCPSGALSFELVKGNEKPDAN